MKYREYIIILLFIGALGLLLYAYSYDPLKGLVIYLSTCIGVTAALLGWIHFLKYKMEKKVHIFISYSYQNKKVAYDVAGNIKDMSVKVGVEDIPIGGNIERSIKKLIGNSLVCFVIIGNNISHTQKSEIKEMLKQKKKIIPIIVSRNANMPYVLKDINPITLDEFMAKPYSLFN